MRVERGQEASWKLSQFTDWKQKHLELFSDNQHVDLQTCFSLVDCLSNQVSTLDGVLEVRNEHFWTVGFGSLVRHNSLLVFKGL